MSNQNGQECVVCLETVQGRGGVPLITPGCCGKWLHQTCYDECVKSGNTKCPSCRKDFPNVVAPLPVPPVPRSVVAHQIPAPAGFVQPVPVPTPQQQFVQQRFGNNIRSQTMHRSQVVVAPPQVVEEDPVEPFNVDTTAMDVVGIETTPNVSITTFPEFSQLTTEAVNAFYVRANLKFEESAVDTKKTPLDVVCILDNSGSMEGGKIESLKNAMKFVIGSLSAADRLSVVYFNSQAGVVHGLLRMTPQNKEMARTKVSQIVAGGGTDIYDGMDSGWKILQNRRTKNPASCVFLLTDGQDSSNFDRKKELARTMKANGTSLFVFGFGADHDSAHMNAIANAGEGSFTYVETDDTVIDAFGGAIGTSQGAAIQNIVLTLRGASSSITILDAKSGNYTVTLASDRSSATINFANMYMGEMRDVLLKLQVPAVDGEVPQYAVTSAIARYNLQGNVAAEPLQTAESVCSIQRVLPVNLDRSIVRDLQVDVEVNRDITNIAIEKALRTADSGKFGEAKEILQIAIASVTASVSYVAENEFSQGFCEDLNDALTRVRSRDEYHSGGRAMMSEMQSANVYQRQCFSKAAAVPTPAMAAMSFGSGAGAAAPASAPAMMKKARYQTASSSARQTEAFNSKSSF